MNRKAQPGLKPTGARRPARPVHHRSMPAETPGLPTGWGLGDFAAATVCYLTATLVLAYPLSLNPVTSGPFGQPEALENAWVLSWVGHQLFSDPLALFSAGIFHPLPDALVFSEHLLVPSLIALPFLTLTNDLVLSYNIVLLIAVVSSALGMYLLTAHLTSSRLAATLAGLFYAFIPYRFAQLHLLQLQLYAFLPLALFCLDRFLRTGKRRWSWSFGGLLALQILSGSYLAATAAVATLIALFTLVPGRTRSGRDLIALAAALALALAVVYPFMHPYLETNRMMQTERDMDAIESLSSGPATFLASSSRLYRALGELWLHDDPPERLFPGVTLLMLGAVGTAVLLLRRGGFPRPWSNISCYGLILIAGVVLSFGPKTSIHTFLYEHIVFFRGLANVTRFGFLLFLSLCVLSGFALAWLFEIPIVNKRRKQLATLIAAFFLIESTTAPANIEPLRDHPPEVYTWLARQTQRGAIVELPYTARQTRRLFWARHYDFRPTLGGTSGFVPMSHRWMEVLLERFPSADSIALLKKLDVRYVIVHLDSYTSPDLFHLLNGLARHRHNLLPLRDFGTELVFELRPDDATGRPSPTPTGSVTKLSTVSITPLLEHGDPQPRTNDTQFEIRLDSVSRVSGLRILYEPDSRIPAERIELNVLSDDGRREQTWSTPPDWPALTELITGLLDNPPHGAQVLRFDPIEMKRCQLRLESSEGRPDVSAIEILGSSTPN